jgi:nucleotide-binding universal stress UspA family protein
MDGSALSERALTPALALAGHSGGQVLLMRTPVVEVAMVPTVEFFGNYNLRGLDQAVEKARQEAREYLDGLRRARQQPHLSIHSEVVDGDPAEAILQVAAARRADLIVMSTHGYSGVTRWIMGSVTERVLSHAPCPVLVIRSDTPLKKMLIPLDGSELSERALAPALSVAAALGAAVTLLRVVREVPTHHVEELDDVERGLGLRVQDELADGARQYLAELVKTRLPQPVETAVRSGPAPSTILNFVETQGVDVVAMATHGRTGAQRWVYGSVTEKVLRNSHDFAMLVVRPRE